MVSRNLKGDRNKSCAKISLWNIPTTLHAVRSLISRKSCFELNGSYGRVSHTAHRAVSNMSLLLFVCCSSFIGYRAAVVTQGSEEKGSKTS